MPFFMSNLPKKIFRKKWLIINFGIGLVISIILFNLWKIYIHPTPTITKEKIAYDIEALMATEQYNLKIYDNTKKIGDLHGVEKKDHWQISGQMYDSNFQINYQHDQPGVINVQLEEQEYQVPIELMGTTTLKGHLSLLNSSFTKEMKWEYSDEQVTIPLALKILEQEVNSFFKASFNYSNFPVQVSYVLWYDNLEKSPVVLNIILKNNDHQFFQRLEYRFLDTKVK